MMIQKVCGKCKQKKSLSAYALRHKGTSAHHTICKACINAYAQEYRQRDPELRKTRLQQDYQEKRAARLAQKKEYFQKNREKIKAARRTYYHANKERIRENLRITYPSRQEKVLLRNRIRMRENKLSAFDAYGGRFCACCHESNTKFLSIDHINGCGKEQRKQEGLGSSFYAWLKKHKYPPGNYQVLCFNCNLGRQANGGTCPHKDQSRNNQ